MLSTENKKKHLFLIILFFLAIIKIYLINCQKLTMYGYSMYDDRLFIDLAYNLKNGFWLGDYNQVTLAKGPVYPLWIALNAIFKVPLLKANHILYIIAVLLLIIALYKMFNYKQLLTLYVLLIFNPMSFNANIMNQTLRSNIYPALTLLTIAFIFLIINSKHLFVKIINSVFAGFCFSALWFTREETIWIVPFILIIFSYYILKNIKNFLFLFIIVSIFFTVNFTLKQINNHYYGKPVTLEIKHKSFVKAYSSLIRIKPPKNDEKLAVPVTNLTRNKLYELSPAFRELKPFLEGDRGKLWSNYLYSLKKHLNLLSSSEKDFYLDILRYDFSKIWLNIWENLKNSENNEIYGPLFIWAFKDSVYLTGYNNLTESLSYYDRLGNEIINLCKSKKLNCFEYKNSIVPPWKKNYLSLLTKSFLGGVIYLLKFKGFYSEPPGSSGDNLSLKIYKIMTNEYVMPLRNSNNLNYKDFRFRIMNILNKIYGFFTPFLIAISIAIFISEFIIKKLSSFNDKLWVIKFSMLSSILSLLLILSYANITSFPGFIPRYLAPLHPLILLFIFISLTQFKIFKNE